MANSLGNRKEVRYDMFCKKCSYQNTPEDKNPCNECLTHGSRKDSHIPLKFKERIYTK